MYYTSITFLLLSLAILNTYGSQHMCNHDSDISYDIPSDYLETFEAKFGKRNLQTGQNTKPFRVTFDSSQLYNTTNGPGMTDSYRSYLIQIMKGAQVFLRNFIQVVPRQTPITSYYGWAQCGQSPFIVYYPPELQRNGAGIPNSDMHLLVTYFNDTTSSQLASAGFCELNPGPIIGRVRFNIGTLKMNADNSLFQDNFSVALHELTHALGFSGGAIQYWIDPDTGQPYGSNVSKVLTQTSLWGINGVNKLSSKNVVQTAKNHYACPTINGMFLENQGGDGSMGSHWERDLIKNEYMTASQVLKSYVVSEFTAALLRDTGFYAGINSNMVGTIYWGKNKGCDFFQNVCNSTLTTYPEFPVQQNGQQYCDFYSMAIGIVSSTRDTFSQCPVAQPYSNQFCQDPNNQPSEWNRMNTGVNSYCFQSTSIKNGWTSNSPGFNSRCNIIKCSADFSTITVYLWQQETITCTTPGQVIDLTKVSSTTYGNFTCPNNFQMVCNYPKTCPNQCSSNGICNNGYCICIDGYAGQDCSITCAYPNVYDGTNCVTACTGQNYKNPDNTCKPSCPMGYYQDSSSNTCILCHTFCSACTGALSTQCSSCNMGYELSGSTCNSYTCDSTCGTCNGSGPNKCTSCNTGYTLSGSTCLPTCHPSCKTCSAQNNPNACTSCNDGNYLSNNQCVTCPAPCGTCVYSNSQVICNSCTPTTSYTFDSTNKVCNPICDPSCLACTQPQNSNACSSCPSGSFLQGSTCQPCQSPCKTCLNSATSCRSCVSSTNYTYDSVNFVCQMICHSSCSSCTKPNDQTQCTKCVDGYYLNGTTCTLCNSPCKFCSSATQCLSCVNNTDYTYDPNAKQCISNCYQYCSSCSKPSDSNSCTACKDGYYLSGSQCLQCSSPCSKCTSNANQCTGCISGYSLDSSQNKCNIQCYQTCKTCSSPNNQQACNSCIDGYFIQNNQCLQCQSPCATCSNSSTNCINCANNYQKNNQNICQPICDSSCKSCSSPKNSNSCTDCFDGSFLNANNQCIQCQKPCQNCVSQATKCTSCINNTDYTFDNVNQICNLVCNNTCSSCFGPNDNTKCNSCIDGYYLDGTTCKQCSSPCSKCSQSPTQCTGCIASYQLNNQNQCIPSCDSSCNTCSKPLDKNSCITCNTGYTMVNSLCQQCTYPCSECQTSQTNCTKCAPSHVLSGNVCQPTCDDSCLTCSKLIDPNSCTSCSPGFYLLVNNQDVQGSCKQCLSVCQTCKDGQTCQECIQGYLLQKDGSCSPICDASCLTCSKPNDRNSCLSCSAPLVLQNSQCQQCGDGFYYDNGSCSNCTNNCKSCSNKLKCEICLDGYVLDSAFNCIKSNTCHLTCQNCIGDSYYQCTFCAHSRQLVKIDESLSYGICQCPEDTTDNNEPECEQSKVQKNVKQTIIGSFAGSAFTSILISVGLQNPLIALTYFQLSQGISYLNLVNAKQSVGFDEALRVISFSNFDFQQFKSPSKNINNKRILSDQSSNIDLVNDSQIKQNPKIALNNKNYNFLENSQPILWIQGFAWAISLSTYLISKYIKIQSSFIKNIKKYTVISLPIITFAVCSQEMWLCIFYQFVLQSNGLSDAGQLVCSIFAFIYMISVLCYLFYQLEYKKCLNTRQFKKSLQTIDVNSPQNLQIMSDTNLEDQKKFYFLNLYVKQDSFATRNIIQIIVLLKMIISIAVSCISQNAYAQIILFILSYFAFCVYISLFRPLKQVKYNAVLLSIYFITTVISIIYAVSINFQNDAETSKTLSLVMLSIIISTYIVFLAFWTLILLHLIYNWLKKCIYKDFQLNPQDLPKKLPQHLPHHLPQLSKDEQVSQLNMVDNTHQQLELKSGQFSQNQLQPDKSFPGFNNQVKIL
ncbi:hypothetical protein ABPG74_006820 [Tetrahymena malaccensis]